MPYHSTYSHYSAIGLTEEEERERALALREREVVVTEAQLEISRQRLEAERKGRIWDALQVIAIAGIPIITFLGWDAMFRKKCKR